MAAQNKIALITGANRGIGLETARQLGQQGYTVLVAARSLEKAEGAVTELKTQGIERAVPLALDVSDDASVQAAAAEVTEKFGKLDALVNNAGITARGNVEETSVADWTRTMDINVKGAFLGSKQAIPIMRAGGGGSIVNISSGAGIAPQPGTSGAYAASKGAVRIFSKSTAIQYAAENIRCNSVHPGPIETDMLRATRPDENNLEIMKGRVPLGRFGRAEEIAYGVLYLASDESSFVTGSELVIDGGRTAQ